MDPKKFKDRSEITVDVHVTDTDGRPVSAELSMAATDTKQGLKNPDDANIITHLLLQSDLKGHITEPGLLFRNQKKATLHALDLVMLTHGWRKIPWSDNDAVTDSPKDFNFVKGLSISGRATSLNNKPLGNTPMTVIAKSGSNWACCPPGRHWMEVLAFQILTLRTRPILHLMPLTPRTNQLM